MAQFALTLFDIFETILIKDQSNRFKYVKDSIADSREIKINLNNFPFKSLNLIRLNQIGSTDLIRININLKCFY